MRLWSLHPSYLDAKGLVACWREGLLARKVLMGKTRGYRNHPQLARFINLTDPVVAIDQYLSAVLAEAEMRGYKFNPAKIHQGDLTITIPITMGQLEYELAHLRSKLLMRDVERYKNLELIKIPLPNPIFRVIEGNIEAWERVKLP